MMYGFDEEVNRYGTYSMKYNTLLYGKPEDVQPMWVADMDFHAPPCIREAISCYGEFGVFGYSEPDSGYFEAVQNWFLKRFGCNVEREWLAITPGVVNAIYIAVRALTNVGDGVVIQQPVYYPFESAVRHTGRKLLINQLVNENGHYSIDFDDFEAKAKQAKMFILCSPHNPVGRVWTQEELSRMGEICLKYGVIVIADEIWQDLIYPNHKHIVFASLAPEIANLTVTTTAPSKTFNVAGLQHANIFISNRPMHQKFVNEFYACGLSQPNLLGLVACKAAYEHGGGWLSELISYLDGNMSLVRECLQKNDSKVKMIEPQATYLAWLDCSALGVPSSRLDEIITHEAKLWLNDGVRFGAGGEGFLRMNIACPHKKVKSALNRFIATISDIENRL
jgi:cystathionine beta-lyase